MKHDTNGVELMESQCASQGGCDACRAAYRARVLAELGVSGCTQQLDCECSICGPYRAANPADGCGCGCEGDVETHVTDDNGVSLR